MLYLRFVNGQTKHAFHTYKKIPYPRTNDLNAIDIFDAHGKSHLEFIRDREQVQSPAFFSKTLTSNVRTHDQLTASLIKSIIRLRSL